VSTIVALIHKQGNACFSITPFSITLDAQDIMVYEIRFITPHPLKLDDTVNISKAHLQSHGFFVKNLKSVDDIVYESGVCVNVDQVLVYSLPTMHIM
jgi:membrane protease subunit (stomatin/prohibitin family)